MRWFYEEAPPDVGQDEKEEELTQQKCERASGLSRGTEERKKTREETKESLLYSGKTHLQQIELCNK